jgi:hypothetical protein
MATTDEYIKYDIRFFDEFVQYLDFDVQDTSTLKKAVEMGLVQRERLVELAISAVSGIPIDSRHGRDHADGSDTKTVVSGFRNNNIKKGEWTNSFCVRNIATKSGSLRVVAYNKFQDRFHYFYIPNWAFQHCSYTVEIPIERVSRCYQTPDFKGIPNKTLKWWQYECFSFEEMCQKNDNFLVDKHLQTL